MATLDEALELRAALPEARVLVMGPVDDDDVPTRALRRLELVAATGCVPEDIPVHLKLDTGMGRWGLSELPSPTRDVVGVMSHLAASEADPEFTGTQIERFRAGDRRARRRRTAHREQRRRRSGIPRPRSTRSAAASRSTGSRPSGRARPTTASSPRCAGSRTSRSSSGSRRGRAPATAARFVAERPTWIGIVPVGYADGFRRDLTGTEVAVAGERRRVVGTISMDALAVELAGELPEGTPVTLIGDGVLIEEHARVAGTIGYEIATGLDSRDPRARRVVVG